MYVSGSAQGRSQRSELAERVVQLLDGQIGSGELLLQCLASRCQAELVVGDPLADLQHLIVETRLRRRQQAAGRRVGGNRRRQIAERSGDGTGAAEQVLDADRVAIER